MVAPQERQTSIAPRMASRPVRQRTGVLAGIGLAVALALTGCGTVPAPDEFPDPPRLTARTPSLDRLATLPPPARQLVVAVYQFGDQTGQNKPNDDFPEYSRAVTQGAGSVLVNALKRTGNGAWFRVVERASLPALLQERRIIRQMREAYGGNGLPPLPPLVYAGLLLDGGIIGYDSNIVTGGAGARFLGIGADRQYRKDTVTVYLRAISVQTGEVLKSVSASKTIYSVALRAGAFRYIDFQELLEVEVGTTTNEPVLLAVRQAIEKAVHALVAEGLLDDYWTLGDPAREPEIVGPYLRERDGIIERASYDLPPGTDLPAGDRVGPETRPLPSSPGAAGDDARTFLTVPQVQAREPRAGAPEAELDGTEAATPEAQTGPTYVLPTPDGRSPIPNGQTRRSLPAVRTDQPVPR